MWLPEKYVIILQCDDKLSSYLLHIFLKNFVGTELILLREFWISLELSGLGVALIAFEPHLLPRGKIFMCIDCPKVRNFCHSLLCSSSLSLENGFW